jgi:hypothetical protein
LLASRGAPSQKLWDLTLGDGLFWWKEAATANETPVPDRSEDRKKEREKMVDDSLRDGRDGW